MEQDAPTPTFLSGKRARFELADLIGVILHHRILSNYSNLPFLSSPQEPTSITCLRPAFLATFRDSTKFPKSIARCSGILPDLEPPSLVHESVTRPIYTTLRSPNLVPRPVTRTTNATTTSNVHFDHLRTTLPLPEGPIKLRHSTKVFCLSRIERRSQRAHGSS